MSDWLSTWRSKWETPAQAGPPDFLSAWRSKWAAPDDSEDWEPLGAIQRNRRTGETRPRPQPGALPDTEAGIEDVRDTAAGGRSTLLADMVKAGTLNNAWGPFVGIAEKLGAVTPGTRSEIRTSAEEARDRYLQAHPEGGVGRAVALAAGDVAMGLPGPSSLFGAGAGAGGARLAGALGGGKLAGALAATGAGALEQTGESYLDAIDLPFSERLKAAAIGGGLGLAGGLGSVHAAARGGDRALTGPAAEAYARAHGATDLPSGSPRGPGRPALSGGPAAGGAGLVPAEQAASSDLARAGRPPRAPLLTGAGDEVPRPSGVVFRGQADAPGAPWVGQERLGAHIPGFHVTEDEALAAQFAEGYGKRGRVVSGEVAADRPFSVARRYSYDELRELDADAALVAAKEQGITAPEEPIDGGLFWKALRDREAEALGGDPRDAVNVTRSLRLASDRLASMGFDAVHHEVGAGKANAWALIGDRGFAGRPPDTANGATRLVTDPATGRPAPGGHAYTEGGERVPFVWRLREADDLIASHNTRFDPDPRFEAAGGEQPRNRDRAGMQTQVHELANKLEPELLAENPLAAHGAPIISGDGIVESGNGRTMALKLAYERNLPTSQAYKAWVADNAGRLGLDATGMQKPVLVRERLGDMDRAAFAAAANQTGMARMGAAEQAAADARALRPETFSLFVPNETGAIDTAANRDFVRAFAAEVVPVSEHNAFFDPSGALSTEGRLRVRNALLAAAYDDADAIGRLVEDTSSEMGNVGRAMTQAAPKMARLKVEIAAGTRHDLDISGAVSEAAVKMDELRRSGLGSERYLAQTRFAEELTPEALELLTQFDKLKRSGVRMTAYLERYQELVDKAGDPSQGSLFMAANPPTKLELLKEAAATWDRSTTLDLGDAAGETAPPPPSPAAPPSAGAPLGLVGPALGGLPDLGRLGALAKQAKEWVRSTLTNYGDFAALGKDASAVAERARMSTAERAAHEARAAVTLRDFQGAMGRQMDAYRAAGIARTERDVLAQVTDGLEGKADLSVLTPELQEVVGRMRSHLDELTGGLLENAQLTKDLRFILEKNTGSYLRRTYEIHRDPGAWEKVAKETEPWRWENAKRFVGEQHPDWTPDQVDGYLNSFFQKQGEAATGLAPRSDVFRIDKGVFKHRESQHLVELEGGEVRTYPTAEQAEKAAEASRRAGRKATVTEEPGLPKELEDFLGLHADPRPRYAEAVAKMAHDLATSKLLTEVAETIGAAGVLFDQPTGQAAARIAGDQRFNPLAGRYTTPEVKAVVEGIGQLTARGPAWLEKVYAVNALVRSGKTAGSPLTHVRNFLSWVPMLVANGHFSSLINVPALGHAVGTAFGAPRLTMQGRVMRGVAAVADSIETIAGKRLGDAVRIDLPALRAEYEQGIKLGIVGDGARSQELARYLGILAETKPGKALAAGKVGGAVVQAATAPGGLLRTAYAAEDDVGKLLAWRTERANYAWAYPDKTPDEVAELAAALVRDLYPTYSKASPGIRAIRDFPFVGDFPTFWAEIARTSKNILKQGATELADPNVRVKAIGAKRLAGFGAVLAAPAAAAAYFRAKSGVSNEEQEALRQFTPEWNRYSDLVVVEKKGPGRYSLIDASYINPYQQFREGWNALLANGLRWDERVGAVFEELASPFKDESIVASAVMDVARNRTADGRQVYPEFATWDDKALAAAKHVGGKLEPGLVSQARDVKAAATGAENPKTGRTVDPEKLLYSFLTGTRQLEIDVSKKLIFQARDLQRARTEAVSAWKRVKLREGTTPAAKLEARTAANENWGRALDDMRRSIDAARATGLSDYQIRRKLDADSQLSQETLDALMRGGYFEVTK